MAKGEKRYTLWSNGKKIGEAYEEPDYSDKLKDHKLDMKIQLHQKSIESIDRYRLQLKRQQEKEAQEKKKQEILDSLPKHEKDKLNNLNEEYNALLTKEKQIEKIGHLCGIVPAIITFVALLVFSIVLIYKKIPLDFSAMKDATISEWIITSAFCIIAASIILFVIFFASSLVYSFVRQAVCSFKNISEISKKINQTKQEEIDLKEALVKKYTKDSD